MNWAELSANVASQIIENAPDALVGVDADGRIVYANRQVEDLFGWSRPELTGQLVEVLIPLEFGARHAAHRASYRAVPARRSMGSGLDLVARRRDGTTFPAEISLSPLEFDGETMTLAAVRDVSELRRARHAAEQARQDLATLDDRERIARDLHDTVIQRIFGVGLQLQAVGSMVDGAAAIRILTAVDDLDETIRDLRTTVFRLHVERARRDGPRDRVIALTEAASRSLGFDPQLRFEGLLDAVIDAETADALAAVVQEALSNCARHAQATSCVVSLSNTGGELRLEIRDNGLGFDERTSGPVIGDGIANIRSRAQALGGTASVRTGDDGGTIVSWTVPILSA